MSSKKGEREQHKEEESSDDEQKPFIYKAEPLNVQMVCKMRLI